MKLNVCDLCIAHNRNIVEATATTLVVGDLSGELDLCTDCHDKLEAVVAEVMAVGRIPLNSGQHQCPECPHIAQSKEALRKHRERHAQARQREQEFAASGAQLVA